MHCILLPITEIAARRVGHGDALEVLAVACACVSRYDGTHGVAVGAGNRLSVHLERQDAVAKRVHSLVEGEGTTVLIAHFIVIHAEQTNLSGLLGRVLLT